MVSLTVYVAQEQQKRAEQEDREQLATELAHAKDHLRDILYSDITVANSMAVIYREYGFQNNFDSIASAVLSQSEYAQVVQLTVDGIITNVYPLTGYENTIGMNLRNDSLRGPEYERATEKKEIFFAGPRPLRGGGTGILGKVPVIVDDTAKGLIVVLTKIDLIQQNMNRSDNLNLFAYELIKKTPGLDTSRYFLSVTRPSMESPSAEIEIPEGDWILRVAYSEGYSPKELPLFPMLAGLVIGALAFILVFRIANRNSVLGKVISKKEQELIERVKELTTIYTISTILQDEDSEIAVIAQRIVDVLPAGWQHQEFAAAKISYDGLSIKSANYSPSDISQRASFSTSDGKSGEFEIVYVQGIQETDGDPFLNEERELLQTIASRFKAYVDKRIEEESRQRSEARFTAGFEHAAIGMALVSLEGRWISVNRALCDMIGYTADELIGRAVADFSHPDDLLSDREDIQRAMSGEVDYYRKEKRYLHKDGTHVWIKLNVALIRDGGVPLYFVGQVENITDKLESDMKFRNLVEKSMVGVYIIQNNRFAYVNPKIIEQSEYSETELAHMPVERFVHPDDVKRVKENIRTRISGEVEGVRYDVRAFTKSGTMLWLEMFGSTTMYQGKPAIIGTMVNITDKKNAFNDLVKSEANLKTVFNTSKIGYMLLDTRLNVLAANEYFRDGYFKQTGFQLKNGDNFINSVLPERRETIRDLCNRALASGKVVLSETSYPNPDGSMNYYESTYAPVITDGKVIGLCYTGIEVTSRKRSELERQKLHEERLAIIEDLTKRNRDLEQFSYIISHNVRGPLATILGLSNMVTSEIYTPEVKLNAIQGIQKSANNLDAVLFDMNDILSLRKNNTEQRIDVNLDEIFETAKQMAAAAIDVNGCSFSQNFTAAPTVYGLKSYLQNVFYNMITNAVKYAKPASVPELEIWSELTPTHVVLHFKDKGIGIDLNKHGEYMFGLYKRFHLAAEGKGMGLFMVKTQVEALEGSIKVESTPNEGTHFIIHLKKQAVN